MAPKTTNDAQPRKNNPAMTAVALIIAVMGATFALLYLYKVSRTETIIPRRESTDTLIATPCQEIKTDSITTTITVD